MVERAFIGLLCKWSLDGAIDILSELRFADFDSGSETSSLAGLLKEWDFLTECVCTEQKSEGKMP